MPRLRTTAALSFIGLLVGIAGTHGLSGFTDDWTRPPPHAAIHVVAPRHRASMRHRSHVPPRVVGAQPEAVAPSAPAPSPALVPLDTPPGPAPWAQLRGHLDGRVVLALATDAGGRVTTAHVARSSGDPVLDARALATVWRWRFAVPPGRAGVQGELPMRFDSSPAATPP